MIDGNPSPPWIKTPPEKIWLTRQNQLNHLCILGWAIGTVINCSIVVSYMSWFAGDFRAAIGSIGGPSLVQRSPQEMLWTRVLWHSTFVHPKKGVPDSASRCHFSIYFFLTQLPSFIGFQLFGTYMNLLITDIHSLCTQLRWSSWRASLLFRLHERTAVGCHHCTSTEAELPWRFPMFLSSAWWILCILVISGASVQFSNCCSMTFSIIIPLSSMNIME